VSAVLVLGVKRIGRESYHFPPSSTAVKNEWSYTSVTSYAFTTSSYTTLLLHEEKFFADAEIPRYPVF
jgi:hypothetical protein